MYSTALAWELVPFSFRMNCWHFDPELGWLEYCDISEEIFSRIRDRGVEEDLSAMD
jgi:hypothetical protein